MVFKFRSVMEDGTPCWEYFDNVRSANSYYSKGIDRTCVTLFFSDDVENGMVVPIEYEGYLMNNNGKTIEKFCGNQELKNFFLD